MMSAEPIFSKLLLDNSVKTSVVVRHAREGDVIGREYIIMDYIPSVPMSEVGKNVCNYKKLKRTYQEIGQLTRKMNSISNPKFGWLRNHDRFLFDTWYEFICFFSDEITHKLALNNIFNAQFLERFNVIIKNSKEVLSMVKESNLSHTDLWQGNVLISKSNYEVLAIIDVDRAIFGDRYWDLSTPWIINKDFLMGYGESFPKEKEIKQRMQIYALLSSMVSCYVRKIQYNDIKQFYKEKTSTIKLLDKIYKEFS
jgi:fructosamine-3-kinase